MGIKNIIVSISLQKRYFDSNAEDNSETIDNQKEQKEEVYTMKITPRVLMKQKYREV